MSEEVWSLVGALGMFAIEASYLPQIVRLWRVKASDELSVYFPGVNLVGRLLALAYALHAGEAVLGAGFLAGIALRATFLGQVIYYRQRIRGAAPDLALSLASARTVGLVPTASGHPLGPPAVRHKERTRAPKRGRSKVSPR